MTIRNQRNATILSQRTFKATRLIDRMVGLLKHEQLQAQTGMWIRPCQSVHTFFMRFSIDVAFVDRNGVLVDSIHDMAPFRMSRWVKSAVGVLELPAGTLIQTDTRKGDQLVAEGEAF